MKLTKEKILKEIEKNKDKIKSFGVKNLWLFGSYIRGEQKGDSDIDFLVEFDKGRGSLFKDHFTLWDFLEEIFKKKVDLGEKNMVREELKDYINVETSVRCEI